jgi:Asp-tRNA(Asn)/Glu-tRNA(Gln) amidotransferase A subunit family amidase
MSQNLALLSAAEVSFHLKSRDITAVQVTKACLEQIRQLDSMIHAWTYLEPELALQRAEAMDEKIRDGKSVGALIGVPIGVKDIFNTVDMPTQMGSPIWSRFTPGNDARVVHYLRLADGVILGKTCTAEFAVHAPGPTANPQNLAYTPGTSSSGSAAAVAAYMVPLALGTQTAGSTIRPASYCGVYGFKPSFGLIARTGMLKTTDTLDTIGFFARTIEDLVILFDVIRVHGPDYPISDAILNDSSRQKKGDKPWRIGLVKGPKWDNAEAYAQRALFDFADNLSKLDNTFVQEVSLPDIFDSAHDIHSCIYDRTLAYYFREEFKKRTLISPIMYEIIERGNQITPEHYNTALEKQSRLAKELDDLFARSYDILLNLSTGGEALKGLDSGDRPDNCLIWTLCGVPVINLPVFCGPNRLPFGAQIVGRRYNDYLLLSFGQRLRAYECIPNGTYPAPALIFEQINSDRGL